MTVLHYAELRRKCGGCQLLARFLVLKGRCVLQPGDWGWGGRGYGGPWVWGGVGGFISVWMFELKVLGMFACEGKKHNKIGHNTLTPSLSSPSSNIACNPSTIQKSARARTRMRLNDLTCRALCSRLSLLESAYSSVVTHLKRSPT